MSFTAVFNTDVYGRYGHSPRRRFKRVPSTFPKEAPLEDVIAEARRQGAKLVVLTGTKRGKYYFKMQTDPNITTEEIIAECKRHMNTTTRVLKNGTRMTKWDTRTIWIL